VHTPRGDVGGHQHPRLTGAERRQVAVAGGLREVAVQAALRARFSPTKLSGQPVKVSGLINYKFALAL